MPPRLTVLGPQRRPTVGAVIRELGPDVSFAAVTAGWEEREPDDGELAALVGGRCANLRLYARWLDVLDRDREYATAELDHRAVLDELQGLYLVQLDHALRAVYAVATQAAVRPRARTAALADAEAVVRLVDRRHGERVRAAQADFRAAWKPADRPVVAEHRAEVGALLGSANAVLVAGGHVGVLLRVLRLFGIAEMLADDPPEAVLAWSAGAMALTERIVLFHDRAAQGPTHAEVYDDGLGLIPGAVLLPHARRRLRVDDRERMAVLARRFAPARCVLLDDGVRVDLGAGGALPGTARVLTSDGRIMQVAAS
jgi:hypothetical protein